MGRYSVVSGAALKMLTSDSGGWFYLPPHPIIQKLNRKKAAKHITLTVLLPYLFSLNLGAIRVSTNAVPS